MRVTAVVLAAGRGRRMGGDENKTFLQLAGRPLLCHALSAFAESSRIDEIVVVVRPGEEERVRSLLPAGTLPVSIVAGGDVRRDSAIAGVGAATGEIVLIHDGARPFPSPSLIDRVTESAIRHGACVPALPVVDTLRSVDDGLLGDRLLDRSELVRIQTPQGFRRSSILRALPLSSPNVPDDAGAILALGEKVWTVPGELTNLKVTNPADFAMAEAICERLGLLTS